jgi:hypothetical protein
MIGKMMIKSLFFMLFLTFLVSAQDNNKKEIVAKAGSIEITAEEFENRFNLNPQLEIHRKAQAEGNKKVFLYGLIAEKLLALEAAEYGMDTSETVQFYLKNFEKLYVRDELYRKEIKQKSKDYANSILSFYLENSSRIFTKSIILKDEESINNIHSILNKGVPFDSIYSELLPQERDTITLYAGTLDNRTEQELFSLPEKSFSKPLKYNEHWVIFYIENKNDPVIAQSMGWETEYKRLEKAAAERAEAVFYLDYMEKFFPEKKVDASGLLIHSLAAKVNHILEAKGKKENDDYYLGASEIINIARSFPADSLYMEFVKMDENPLTLSDFLLWLRTENFVLKENTYRNAVSLLNGKVKKFIEFELLAREGYRQGLDKSENVLKYTAMWKDNYLYQLRLTALSDSLTGNNTEVIKIAEIVNNDLEVMERVLNELAAGRDFLEAAGEYSLEEPDTSWRSASTLKDLRDETAQLKVNDVFGPVSTERGFVIFKVIGRKSGDEITAGRSAGILDNPFNGHISGLAKKYGISINEDVLTSIKRSNVNALVFKYIGFGGRITAVPIILPIAEWIKEYREEIQLNP